MIEVKFNGSSYESQREAPDGVTETLELWLRSAGLIGQFTYRVVDRAKGTGTMAPVHAIGTRDNRFVNARIRPAGGGNENSWMISIPSPAGLSVEALLAALRSAEPFVNGDQDPVLEAKLEVLFDRLDGQAFNLTTIDLEGLEFETIEELEIALDALSARKKLVQKTGPRSYEWRRRFSRPNPPPPHGEHAGPTAAAPPAPRTENRCAELTLLREKLEGHQAVIVENERLRGGLMEERATLEREIAETSHEFSVIQAKLNALQEKSAQASHEDHLFLERITAHQTEARTIEEEIAVIERSSAAELADNLADLVKGEARRLGISNEVVVEEMRSRLRG